MRLRRVFSVLSVVLACGLVVAFASPANAVDDTISGWTFETNTPPDLSDSSTGPTVNAETGPGSLFGFHASTSTDWTTPVGNGSANAYSANTWAVEDYFQIQTSTTGFSNIGLWLDQASSSTGPRDFRVDYSLNGSTFTSTGLTYAVNSGSFSGSGSPNQIFTRTIDLRQYGLDNQPNVYLRLVMNSTTSLGGGTVGTGGTSRIDNVRVVSDYVGLDPPPPPPPTDPARLPVAGDVVFGLDGSASFTLELVSGEKVEDAEVRRVLNPWGGPGSIQSVEFDNYGGQSHNVRGNLLGVAFGSTANGGTIYSFGTNGTVPLPAGQPIGNTRPSPDNLGHSGAVTLSRLGGLSVSPDNLKVAVAGYDAGTVVVYDYTAGNTQGNGTPSLADGRQTPDSNSGQNILTPGSSQGTAWLDNDTVLAFASFGALYEVEAGGMTSTQKAFVNTPSIGSNTTSLAYNPDVSGLVYAMYSGFAGGIGSNMLYVFDPANNYSLVNDIDISTSMGSATGREIALDADGNLLISSYGSGIHIVPAASLAAGTDNSSFLWYTSPIFSQFTGIDVGFGEAVAPGEGDINGDGVVDILDYVVGRMVDTPGTGPELVEWAANYGNNYNGSAAGAGVPEPATLGLLALGLAAACCGRRRAA